MMLKAAWAPYTLHFRETAVTSRARMHTKDTYIIKVWDSADSGCVGWGECALFRGLSAEDTPHYESVLTEVCRNIGYYVENGFPEISSLRFGFEMALADLKNGGKQLYFATPWAHGKRSITINGLIWMGDKHRMARRIREKLDAGFRCVKLKIGGIDFNDEVDLLRHIRSIYSPSEIELRLDANGAFPPDKALNYLETLSRFGIHSIEQPIKAGQPEEMATITRESPIPIALDEELIGVTSSADKARLLSSVKPQDIILKPSLCGGFAEADEWIAAAQQLHIGWWATSALESDLGLAAIGQWVDKYEPTLPQGLGTGRLYTNNIQSPLHLDGEQLGYDSARKFVLPELKWQD